MSRRFSNRERKDVTAVSAPNTHFSRTLSLLRKEKGASQREAAGALGISQALLSHYENGLREPGLTFVARACDYYNVSADYLLGRTLTRDGVTIDDPEGLYDASAERDNMLRGSVVALLSKKLLMNSIGVLFDLLGKLGSKEAVNAAADYLGGAVYTLFRHLYEANPDNAPAFFNLSQASFHAGAVQGDMIYNQAEYAQALAVKDKNLVLPEITNDTMAAAYPAAYQSLFQVVHNTGKRVNAQEEMRAALRERDTVKPKRKKKK